MSQEILFDASGPDGADARDGSNGRAGSRGGRGGDGLDATNAQPGGSAGQIRLVLGSLAGGAKEGAVSLQAHIDDAHGVREERVLQYEPSEMPTIRLRARGGDGGDGGVGGDGGSGGRGRSGSNATRSRSGTNGGPGGDGGDGGHGTSGRNGGDGGQLAVELADRDTYLLMAVAEAEAPQSLVAPGDGGKRGAHGVGGRGGRGGRGGSSHSWTTTDSNGNTRRRRNSGGSSGRNGRDGRTPNFPLSNGAPGSPGHFEIQVVRPDGHREIYPSRYDLEIMSFDFLEAPTSDEDGIFEFGEVVIVQNLRVKNVGAMPTPAYQRIRLELAAGEWVRPVEDEAIFIEKSLSIGEEYMFPESLSFRIALPKSPPVGEPRIETEPIRPLVFQLGQEGAGVAPFRRRFESATLSRPLTARFPVENRDGVEALRSLAHSERTRQLFEIHNVSNKPLGESSSRKRALAIQVRWQTGEVPAGDLVFLDIDGEEVPLDQKMEGFDGYFLRIPNLAARSSAVIETQVGFRGAVEPYVSATLRFTIWIAELDEPEKWTPVQCRDLQLRLEPAFAYRPESKVLLLSNNRTRRGAFTAWYHLLEDSFGLPTDFWSLSRYGHFDHQVELADRTNLRIQVEDRLVLVLNQHFEPRASSETDLPTDYMRARDFRESATGYNTRYLIVGENDFQMQQWLEPNSDFRLSGSDYPSIKRFLETESKSAGSFVEETFLDDITMSFDEISVEVWTFPFMRPGVNRLYLLAKELQKRLTKLFANRRYVVIYHHRDNPERTGRTWCGFPRWDIGHIEVRRTLNLDKSEAVVLEATDEEINDESFITGDMVRYAVGLALPFEEKLARLNWLLQQPEESAEYVDGTAQMLVRAVAAELTSEQAAARESGAPLSDDFFEQRFANFGRLMRFPFYTHIPQGSEKWEFLFRLCALIEAMTKVQDGGWLFRRRDRHITSYILEQMEGFRSRLFDRYAIDMEGDVAMDSMTASARIEAGVNAFVAEIRREYREQTFRERWRNRMRHVGRHRFQHPRAYDKHVGRDIDEWLEPIDRVWDVHELSRARRDESNREAKQEELRLLNSEVRAELLVRPETATIVASEVEEVGVVEEVEEVHKLERF